MHDWNYCTEPGGVFTPDAPTREWIAAVKGHLIVCADCTAGDYCPEGVSLMVEAMQRRWESHA